MDKLEIIALLIIWVLVSSGFSIDFLTRKDRVYFNPVENYKEWEYLNWFGVSVFTIFINLIFLPAAILYWIFRFFTFIFTVGRK